jgi:hypothetical protein
MIAQLFHHLRRAFLAGLQRHEGDDGLSCLGVVAARNRRFGNSFVADQRALDLDRRDAVA